MDWTAYLSNYFRIDASSDKRKLPLNDITTWDSFSMMEFMSAVYEEFDIQISAKEIFEVKNMENLIELLENKSI